MALEGWATFSMNWPRRRRGHRAFLENAKPAQWPCPLPRCAEASQEEWVKSQDSTEAALLKKNVNQALLELHGQGLPKQTPTSVNFFLNFFIFIFL